MILHHLAFFRIQIKRFKKFFGDQQSLVKAENLIDYGQDVLFGQQHILISADFYVSTGVLAV